MIRFGKTISSGVVAVCLFVSLTAGAWGQTPGSSFGGELRGPIRIRGKVVCVKCSLDEVGGAQAEEGKLYQLVYRGGGQLVIQVSWVSEPQLWSYMAYPPRLWARGRESLFQKLTAEENLFQELEINAVPSHGLQTLDIFEVTLVGRRTPRREE